MVNSPAMAKLSGNSTPAMEMDQELEWKKAQEIAINVDLVAAAARQLEFLAAVDRSRWLYDGPTLTTAIHRYNVCWLPLLAKHSKSPFFDGPLVVPLDCEWIWHCHRLNPVRYKSDCEELYGSILDSQNVASTVQGASVTETERIWRSLYPTVPYEFDFINTYTDNLSQVEKCTKYDLLSAVKRQTTFFYQVDRPHFSNEMFLEGAVARYKGFLHLIRRNRERSINSFCVPTYDVDLIWHTHQLHPVSYCNDLVKLMNKVLEHDDTDSDRTKGQKLDTGFSGTTQQWEEMFGMRYWRAGAMHKGNAPSPVRSTPYPFLGVAKKDSDHKESQKAVHLPEIKAVEVMLEFVCVKNLPKGHKGGLSVSFSKTQPDTIFNTKRSLTIFSESGVKQVACFMCEPTGHLLFELMNHTSLSLSKTAKTMGSGSVSLEDLLSPASNLTMEKWLELLPSTKSGNSEPVYVCVAISVTVPTCVPFVLHMIHSQPFLKNSCFFPLSGRLHLPKNGTSVTDDSGNEIISLEMRDFKKSKGKSDGISRKEVVGIKSGETNVLAEFTGKEWLLVGSNWSFRLPGTADQESHLFELIRDHSVKFFPGGRLEYESKTCSKHSSKQENDELLTGIEFSPSHPYGKAVVLLDLKSGTIKVNEEWMLFPSVILQFILTETLKKHGHNSLITGINTLAEKAYSEEKNKTIPTIVQGNAVMPVTGEEYALGGVHGGSVRGEDHIISKEHHVEAGGCGGGGGCGGSGGCGNHVIGKEHQVEAGGCGGGCGGGGGCGNVLNKEHHGEAGGCGGGCGGSGGCGNLIVGKEQCAEASGCGGGCGGGGGCGNMVNKEHGEAGGCGGGCGGGGGCGNHIIGKERFVEAGGCGGGCGGGGGCGNMLNKEHHVEAGGCGGGCGGGGGCGNHIIGKEHFVEAGGCGGGCGGGGGCGNMLNKEHGEAGGCGGGCGGGGCGSGCGGGGGCGNMHITSA